MRISLRSLASLTAGCSLALALPILAQEGDAPVDDGTGTPAGADEGAAGDTETGTGTDTEPAGGEPAGDEGDDGAGDEAATEGGGTEGGEAATGDATTGEAAEAPKGDDLFADEGPEIPASEYVPTAEKMLTDMRGELSKALDSLARARSEKDAVKLNYINEQVTTMKGIMRISDDAFIALQEAVASRAMEKARYEFGKIRVSHRKMKELAVAIQNAKGAEASYTGGTDVRVEIDEAAVGGDPYYGNPDFFNSPETGVVDRTDDGVGSEQPIDARPPPASPTGV